MDQARWEGPRNGPKMIQKMLQKKNQFWKQITGVKKQNTVSFWTKGSKKMKITSCPLHIPVELFQIMDNQASFSIRNTHVLLITGGGMYRKYCCQATTKL